MPAPSIEYRSRLWSDRERIRPISVGTYPRLAGRTWARIGVLGAMRTILLVLLILLLIGALPAWPYSHSWGYYPSGGLGLILLILIILALFGAI